MNGTVSTHNPNTLTGLRAIKAERARKAKANAELAKQRRDEYVQDIQEQMEHIKNMVALVHGGPTPNWADVGSLADIAEKLADIAASYRGVCDDADNSANRNTAV